MEAATGLIAKAKERLRDTLKQCYYLQRWDGYTFAADELASRLYLDALPTPESDATTYSKDELTQLRPYGLIYKSGEFELTADATTGYRWRGELAVELVHNVCDDYLNDAGTEVIFFDEAERDFDNLVGRVLCSGDASKPGLSELRATAQNDGTAYWLNVSTAGPFWPEREVAAANGWHVSYVLHFTLGVAA